MLAELPRAIYSPVTAGTYGMISCHSLILLDLRPFQHFPHTDRGKWMILIHHSVCLERLVPQPAFAEGVIEVSLLCQFYQIELEVMDFGPPANRASIEAVVCGPTI